MTYRVLANDASERFDPPPARYTPPEPPWIAKTLFEEHVHDSPLPCENYYHVVSKYVRDEALVAAVEASGNLLEARGWILRNLTHLHLTQNTLQRAFILKAFESQAHDFKMAHAAYFARLAPGSVHPLDVPLLIFFTTYDSLSPLYASLEADFFLQTWNLPRLQAMYQALRRPFP